MNREKRAEILFDWAREQGLSMYDFNQLYAEARRRWGLTRYENSETVKIVMGMLEYLAFQNRIIKEKLIRS